MIFNNSPLVSVIIPTYNRAGLLKKSVGSVLSQTFKDFEIIIINDGSTDNTENVIKSFNDSRIKYIKNKKNRGAGAARNIGIKIARGDYIAFQDSDDEWLPEKLKKQIEVFKSVSPSVGVVYSGYLLFKNNKKIYIPLKKYKKRSGNIHKELLSGSFVGTSTMLVKKECFEKVGMFDENLDTLEDWELAIRLSKDYRFKFLKTPLLLANHSINSISSNHRATIDAFKKIAKKHLKESDKKELSNYYHRIGYNLCLCGDYREGRSYYIKSIKLNNFNFPCFVSFALSFLKNNKHELIKN
ncbi:MAG: glycosyltransferase family 2 protein [Candidatus Falkowbacteria bacterium]